MKLSDLISQRKALAMGAPPARVTARIPITSPGEVMKKGGAVKKCSSGGAVKKCGGGAVKKGK